MNHDEDKLTTQQENQNEEVQPNKAKNEANSAESQTAQEQAPNNNEQSDQNNENISDVKTAETWHNKNALKRGIAMLGYGFVAGFVRLGITLIAVFQFFSLLFAEKPNHPLIGFGQNLNTYLYQINQFLTVNSEMYPFPFADWPDSAPR